MNDAGRIGFLIRGEYSDLETYDFLDIVYYNESSYVAKKTSTGNPPHRNNEFWQIFATGGGSATGGVTNYSELENLPKINNVTLNGNKSLEDLGVPTKTSGLVNDSGFKTTDTWKQNTANSEGYVEKGTGHANQVWKTDANGVPGWRPDANTTYGDVTASAHGLMTASDKTKLDGIAAGANKTTLTKSLAVTEEGVSALDGTVGKILDDKISELNDNLTAKLPGEIKVIAEGSGADVKYYAQLGADAASKKLLGNLTGRFHLSLCPSGAQKRYIHFPTLGRNIHIWMLEANTNMVVYGVNNITEISGNLLYTAEKSGFDTVINCSAYEYVCFGATSASNGLITGFYLEYA